MLEPSKKAQNAVAKAEQERIAKLNQVSVSIIGEVRKKTNELVRKIANAKNPKPYYAEIERYLIDNYGTMYEQYKEQIVQALNDSGVEQLSLVGDALGRSVPLALPLYETLPNTRPFRYTNAVLSRKSVLKNNKELAKRVTGLVSKGFDAGDSLSKIQRKLDIEFGFRDAQGRITEKARQLIKTGKFAHTNGHIYQTYRIARTEVMRMADIQTNEVFQALSMEDKRLKLIAKIDDRTREQSSQMNGQISRADGKFKYPDGNWYFKGQAPAQWSINDREASVVVFLRDRQG